MAVQRRQPRDRQATHRIGVGAERWSGGVRVCCVGERAEVRAGRDEVRVEGWINGRRADGWMGVDGSGRVGSGRVGRWRDVVGGRDW